MTVTPRTNAIFVGLGATPTVPGTPGYVEISMDPLVGANVAFQEAIDSLPANGGVLYVMPGTADYVFKATVNVNKPNVTIDFVGGSTLTFASGSFPTTPDMFLVTQRGFRCGGARVVFAINSQNNPVERSCLRIEADDADVSNCTFEIRQGDAAFEIKYFCCIRVVNVGTETWKGIRITRNSFILDENGEDQSAPWIPVTPPTVPFPLPRGVCCIGVERARGVIISGNIFRSSSSTGVKAACGPAIYTLTAEQCAISSNSIRDLRTSPGGAFENRGAVVRMIGGAGEGHHTVLSANVFMELETAFVIGLDVVRYDFITANVFDKIGTTEHPCWSVIRAQGGEVLGVSANSISRITGNSNTTEAAINLVSLANATISGNLFTDVQTGKGVFAVEPGTCTNIQIDSQQALADNVP